MAMSPKYCVSVSGPIYARARERCLEIGITMGDLVESLVADLDAPVLPVTTAPRRAVKLAARHAGPPQYRGAPRVALEVSDDLYAEIECFRARERARYQEISRSEALEWAILQALESGHV